MKIIQEGDKQKLLQIVRFKCRVCGCIFDADKTEYQWYEVGACYDSGLRCKCPTCDSWAYEYRTGEH